MPRVSVPEFAIQIAGLAIKSPPFPPTSKPVSSLPIFTLASLASCPLSSQAQRYKRWKMTPRVILKCRLVVCYRQIVWFEKSLF